MKINLNQNGGTITYDQDDWLAGLDTTSGGSSNRKLGSGFAFSDRVDPLRFLGYISPSYNPQDVTNNAQVTSLIRNGVINGANAYLIAGNGVGVGGGIVHKLDLALPAGTISTTAPFPHTIDHAHTNETGSDIVNYTANVASTPTLLTFFSFSDNTDWDVGIYNPTADTFNDDYMSTIPASPLAAPYLTGGKSAPHPLIVGDDDILYMGDRNFVHAYDGATGADGTFYPAVLTLPQGWIITCFCKSNDQKLLIGAYYAPSASSSIEYLGSAKAYKWNYLDLDFDYAYDLHDNYVSEMANWNDTVIAFTSGRRSQTQAGTYKLQAIINGGFKVLQTYSTGTLPIRGGVEVVEQDIYWNGGNTYFYAKNQFGENFIFGNIGGSSSGVSGICRLFSSSVFLLHYSNGTQANGFGLQYGSSDYAAAPSAYGKVATPTFPERKRGRLKKVELYFMTTATGGRTFSLNTVLDKDGGSVTLSATSTVTNLQKQVLDFRASGTSTIPLGDFSTLQPQFIWATGSGATDAPVLEKVVYFFEYTDIDQGLQT